jgi:Spy/CpxP family protein refolding chaperone
MRLPPALAIGLLLLGAPASVRAQEAQQDTTVASPLTPTRAALEAQVLDRFVDRAATALSLSDEQRTRLTGVVQQNAARRRDLAHEAAVARRDLARALRNGRTSDADFSQLLARIDSLRTDEQQLEQDEDAQLRRILNPRQHAQFLVLRARFNQRVMQLLRSRKPPRR